jgi:class 3 adenylate cyclase/pimeloyl-ACP methyl ester carboxylesterase
VDVPETRYATASDGVEIAYQRFGAGEVDLVYVPYFLFNLDLLWDFPPIADWLERLGSLARVLIHDPRGTGLSDRAVEPGDIGRRAQDLLAVLDAEGIERAAMLGSMSNGGICALLAAIHPERVSTLIWLNAVARERWAADYPFGARDAEVEEFLDGTAAWGTSGFGAELAAGEGVVGQVDLAFQRWMAKMQRGSVSPQRARSLQLTWFDTDIRDVLPTIRVPTLVVARGGEPEEHAFVASMIPGAGYVDLGGLDAMPWFGDPGPMVAAVRDFLGVQAPAARPQRFLSTILFTDIVDSTARASDAGDARWRDVVGHHHRVIRGLLDAHGGTEMDTAGDGFYAAFDAPGDAVRCALNAVEAVQALGLEIRAGAHTGEVQVADGKHAGLAVAIGARVATRAGASQVLATQTVKDLTAGSGLTFEDAGEHELKGVPDRWHLYRVVD